MSPEQAATQLGMSYLPAGDRAFRDAWLVLPEVNKGGKIKHIIFGEREGVEATAFQHQYTMHTGQAPIFVYRVIVSCEIPPVPATHITAWNLLQRIARKFGLGRHNDVVGSRFGLIWNVKSDDNEFARDLLNDELVAHIHSKPNVAWRLLNGRLCLIYGGRLRAERIGASFDRLFEFRRLGGALLGSDAG